MRPLRCLLMLITRSDPCADLVRYPRTEAQWLPSLVAGEKLAAFALTEREAGSDAANVRMTATPSDDGSHYVLNGEKRYITNAAVSQVWTGNAANAGSGQAGQRRDYRVSRHSRHAGRGNDRRTNAEAWNSRHCTGRFRLSNVRVPERKYSRSARQRVCASR